MTLDLIHIALGVGSAILGALLMRRQPGPTPTPGPGPTPPPGPSPVPIPAPAVDALLLLLKQLAEKLLQPGGPLFQQPGGVPAGGVQAMDATPTSMAGGGESMPLASSPGGTPTQPYATFPVVIRLTVMQ